MKGDTATPMLRVPAYEELRLRVKQAVLDMGIDTGDTDLDTWSAKFVIGADGSEQRGLGFPWYMANHQRIRDHEGGRPSIVNLIAGMALCMLRDDPDLDPDMACLEAGSEWRASIRRQWNVTDEDLRRQPGAPVKSIDQMVHNLGKRSKHDNAVDMDESRVHGYIGLTTEHPADIEQPERQDIQLLRQGITTLSDNERAVVQMRSGGMTYAAIADELGWHGRQSAYACFKRAARKLRKFIERGIHSGEECGPERVGRIDGARPRSKLTGRNTAVTA